MFSKKYWFFFCAVSLVPVIAFGKSSAIPDRREFPVNPDISPCENFFQYSCSKVIDDFQLREDRSSHTFAFDDSRERILEAKKKFLKDLVKKDVSKLSSRSRALGNVYSACMNEEGAKKEETELVKRGLREMFDIEDRDLLQGFLADHIDSPETGFLGFGTVPNLDKPEMNDFYFISGLQSLPERSYYDNSDVTSDLKDLMTEFFKTVKLSQPEERAQWVLDFEKEFAKGFPLPAEWRTLMSTRTSIKREDLVKKYPEFKLERVLKKVPAKTLIRNFIPQTFDYLKAVLKDKPVEMLKSVWLYHSLSDDMDDAYPEFFQKKFDFEKKHLGGPNVRPVREERCTRMVMSQFQREMDAELLPILFPGFSEAKVKKLVEKVRTAIIEGIEKNDWLQAATKQAAREKIKKAKLQIVKPHNNVEWYFNPPAEYSNDKPHANRQTLAKKLIDREFVELREPRNPNRWDSGPLVVNAYYNPSDNKFVMPIGILQYPFYDEKASDEVNLGAVGMVVAHELGHAVDDKGAQFDVNGKLHNWFTEKDLAEFQKRGAKLKDHFDKIGHNGELTLGENIGDLVGITFAHAAAFGSASLKKKSPEELQALERAFFLQYSRLWCNVVRPKEEERRLKTDPHALPRARVNEQVKQQPAFQAAFSCKDGDPMTLPDSERVKIW